MSNEVDYRYGVSNDDPSLWSYGHDLVEVVSTETTLDVGISLYGSGAERAVVLWQVVGRLWASPHLFQRAAGTSFQDVVVWGGTGGATFYPLPSTPLRTEVADPSHARLQVVQPATPQASSDGDDHKSSWADAIGPLYTVEGVAVEIGISPRAVRESADAGAMFAIRSTDGEYLFPVAQFLDSRTVPGLQWVVCRLREPILDDYSLAGWLNTARSELGGRSPWQELREFAAPSEPLKRLVESLRFRMNQ